ncbi:hypothetical protein [Streptomyces sp. enrichment culture]|uniref:pPIWI_RE_Y domain-containing protein n=1 Tax=Streptomyces sp. enrichment culture TaxID=1795815 RepID=UPI003F5742FD
MSILGTLPSHGGRSSPERESQVLLSLVASGLVSLSSWRGHVDRRRPYDGRLQLGLDQLSVACVRKGLAAPTGVGDLVWEWCARRPMREWPLVFDPDAQADGELLLIDGSPSEFCQEWVRASRDVVADVHESALVNHVKDVARALGRPDLYAHWRMLLTGRTVLSAMEMVQQKNRFLDVPSWAVWLDESYEPVPPESTLSGKIAVCRRCRQWMSPGGDGQWTCPSWRCAAYRFGSVPELKPADGAHRLRADLVGYIALPGRPELEFAEGLAARGARVVMYPGYDALDAVATWPDGYAIGVDVKDWRNPFLLARSIKKFPDWSGAHPYAYSKGFIAVPQDRTRGRDGYLRILRKHSSALHDQPHVQVATLEGLIQQCPDLGAPGEVTCGP